MDEAWGALAGELAERKQSQRQEVTARFYVSARDKEVGPTFPSQYDGITTSYMG